MLSAALPAAAMAGTMALSTLPMIASALAGLAGGGQGDRGGGDSEIGDGGLSPESERALKVLELLAKVYGDDETTDPDVEALRKELGITPGSGSTGSGRTGAGSAGAGSAGKGETANAVRARQMFQRNAATAFNNVDNQLLRYMSGLAGNTKVDKRAVLALVREVNVALAQLGPQAYTKQGQQKVRQILAAALQKAHTIVASSNSNSTETANAISRLTNQYLYNIAGQSYTPATGTADGQMPSGTVGDWIKQAMDILQQSGCDMSRVDAASIATIIQNESDGNPFAINLSDSNFQRGTPSKGLMQTIDPTFNQYALPGHTNIYNPVDNIIAGVRYAIDEYGAVSNSRGIKALRSGQDYVGY
ncbi:DUF4226 domain-containing protein [Nocardia sp. NPDC057440]|uniref:DUF4226 domain-containing protein n=1 Tax=Nocardia sp. NPDC057440 TaxID=3346134 RepID=UPI003672A07F